MIIGKTKKRKLNRRRIRALSAILFSIPFVLYTALVPAIKAGAVTTNPGAGVVQLDLDPLNITITNDATFTMTPWMDPGHQKGVMEKGANTEGVYVAFEFSKDITLTVDVNDGATAKKYCEIWPNVVSYV